jgi:hypothetical protein
MIISENIKISETYDLVSRLISPNEMKETVYSFIKNYLDKTKKKSIEEKCIEFYFLRQSFLSWIKHESNFTEDEWFAGIGDSFLDYFDMTFSYLFFNGISGKCAVEKKIDKEFYFCLLSFVIDRVEFPSLISKQFFDSYNSNNRSSISLKRRNYLATTMCVARTFVNQVINDFLRKNQRVPSWQELRVTCKKNVRSFQRIVAKEYEVAARRLIESRCIAGYRLYRGYEINNDQDVIVGRKIRLQDANKSISFTTEKRVAKLYANYRIKGVVGTNTTSLNDRISLAKLMFDEKTDRLETSAGKKCIVSEYVISEKDIILFSMSTTVRECEVIAIPDNAKLMRYTIFNSLQ